jgi:hypothetical protein
VIFGCLEVNCPSREGNSKENVSLEGLETSPDSQKFTNFNKNPTKILKIH